jgi:hypothetical protein
MAKKEDHLSGTNKHNSIFPNHYCYRVYQVLVRDSEYFSGIITFTIIFDLNVFFPLNISICVTDRKVVQPSFCGALEGFLIHVIFASIISN